MAGLEKVTNDLDKQEKAIYNQVRPPLEQNRMVQDSEDRLQELKVQHLTTCLPKQAHSIDTCNVYSRTLISSL